MKIALIAPGRFFQDKDLLQAAKSKGHQLEFVNPNYFCLPPSRLEKKLLKFDLIYWRSAGAAELRETIIQYIKDHHVPVVNSGYFKNPLLRQKAYQLYQAYQKGIKIPKTLLVKTTGADYQKLAQKLGTPFILKKNVSARGQAVWLINQKKELKQIINKQSLGFFLAQKYLPKNNDYRVIIVGGQTAGVIKRIPKKGQFKANISLGGHGEMVCDQTKVKKLGLLAEKISLALNLEIAGIDFLETDQGLFFIESNSIPQWEGFKKTTGIDVAAKIIAYFERLVSFPWPH